MKRLVPWLSLLLLVGAVELGCNDSGTRTTGTQTTKRTTTTTTTHTAPGANAGTGANVDVDAGPNGATATGRTAANRRDAVDVDVGPNGGVDVDVQGQPIRDRIRERRAARDANVPR